MFFDIGLCRWQRAARGPALSIFQTRGTDAPNRLPVRTLLNFFIAAIELLRRAA